VLRGCRSNRENSWKDKRLKQRFQLLCAAGETKVGVQVLSRWRVFVNTEQGWRSYTTRYQDFFCGVNRVDK
jgi:hypothetical protein